MRATKEDAQRVLDVFACDQILESLRVARSYTARLSRRHTVDELLVALARCVDIAASTRQEIKKGIGHT